MASALPRRWGGARIDRYPAARRKANVKVNTMADIFHDLPIEAPLPEVFRSVKRWLERGEVVPYERRFDP